jgi:hypothetical protein
MANPDKYSRGYSFTGYQSNSPTDPLPGPKVDVELDNLSRTTDETIDALGDIRRSDGMINNKRVRWDSLDDDLRLRLTHTGNAITIESFDTIDQARSTDIAVGKGAVFITSRTFAGDGGGGIWEQVDAPTAGLPATAWFEDAGGKRWELAEKFPDVRMFGAVGDGVADDVQAFRDCLSYVQAKSLRGMKGAGTFAFGSTFELNDLYSTTVAARNGLLLEFPYATIQARSNFTPGTAGALGKQPLIGIGRNSSGQQANVRGRIGYLYGNGRIADGIGVGSGHPTAPLNKQNGAAGCYFEITRANDLNIAIRVTASNFGCTENTWRGGIIDACNIGLLFDGPTITGQTGVPIVEAQYIHFGRIAAGWWGNVVFLRKSRYSVAVGDFDLGGQYISKVDIGTGTLPGFLFFQNVTGGTSGATGEILSRYSWRGRNYLLVMHNTSVVNGGSPFLVGETITQGAVSANIVSINTADDGNPSSGSGRPGVVNNRFFYDVIAADPSTPFHRITVTGPWLGGVIGNAMHTINLFGGNQGGNGGENVNMYNDTHGWRFLSTGDQLTAYAVFDDSGDSDPFLEIGKKAAGDPGYFRPRRDLLLSGNRIYGGEAIVTVDNSSTVWDVTAQALPENRVPNGKMWQVNFHGVNFPDVYSRGILIMSASGALSWHQESFNILSVTLVGTVLIGAQGAQPTMSIHRTLTQIA